MVTRLHLPPHSRTGACHHYRTAYARRPDRTSLRNILKRHTYATLNAAGTAPRQTLAFCGVPLALAYSIVPETLLPTLPTRSSSCSFAYTGKNARTRRSDSTGSPVVTLPMHAAFTGRLNTFYRCLCAFNHLQRVWLPTRFVLFNANKQFYGLSLTTLLLASCDSFQVLLPAHWFGLLVVRGCTTQHARCVLLSWTWFCLKHCTNTHAARRRLRRFCTHGCRLLARCGLFTRFFSGIPLNGAGLHSRFNGISPRGKLRVRRVTKHLGPSGRCVHTAACNHHLLHTRFTIPDFPPSPCPGTVALCPPYHCLAVIRLTRLNAAPCVPDLLPAATFPFS